jgi:hypothetical protein
MKTLHQFSLSWFPGARAQTVPRWARCALVGLVLTGSSALPAAAATAMPRRPAAVFALHRGNMEPVVGAGWDNRPIIMDGDRRVTVEPTAAIGLNVGHAFAAGRVEIRNLEALGWARTYTANNVQFSQRAVFTEVNATLVSETDLPDVFIVIVAFAAGEALDAPPLCTLFVSDIGRLEANKPKRFSSRFPPVEGEHQWNGTALVFSGGLEVRSSGGPDLLPQFFDSVERYKHGQRMQERAHGADAAIEVFRQFPVELPGDLKAAYSGQTVQVRLTISPQGNVSDLELVDLKDPKLAGELRNQFGWWLFLPAVKNGVALERPAILPLRL